MHAAALEAFPYPVLIHDQDVILFVNAVCRGYLRANSSDQLVGQPVGVIVHEHTREAGVERRRLLFEQDAQMGSVPVKLRALDGTTLYAICDGGVITFDGRKAILITGRISARSTPA